MIARVWSAEATPDNAPAYAAHLRAQVIPQLQEIAGYAGSMLLERAASGTVEILVITYWESMDAIQRFAGSGSEQAVVANDAAAVLTRFNPQVRHYTVSAQDGRWIPQM
ncbi:MAG TPA: antibiotic biosynthesis monooxygenase [Candidatus Baltobacteraceae bacterium]|nr:antibiotic biosynthesis monooxygenase [Candidatus Baltobacteraceae bacterium]